jgi:serine/threonine-protein kinase
MGQPISSAARGTAAGTALSAGEPTAAVAAGDPTMAMYQTEATKVVGGRGGRQHNTATLPAIGRDPSEVPPKHHGATYALLALAVIAALVLVGLAGKAIFGGNEPLPRLTVPTVVNMTQTQAEAKLRTAGFAVEVSTATNPATKGTVFDQSPRPGEKYPAQTKVTITVSSGPGEALVPDVSNYTEESAKATLESSGLKVGEVESVNDPGVDKGKVIETDPEAGDTVSIGSRVDLKVASGQVKVPDVVGESRGDAQQTLTDARLTYKTTFRDSDKDEGTVLSQTRTGDTVDVGTEIVLVVSQVPQPTTPPTTTAPPTTAPPTSAPPTTAPPTSTP